MATPALTVINKSFNLYGSAINQLTWNILDITGAAQNLTGFSASLLVRASSGSNPKYASIDLGPLGTFTYGSDGTLTFTLPLYQTNSAPGLQNAYMLLLSNDSFVTQCQAATGTVSVNNGVA